MDGSQGKAQRARPAPFLRENLLHEPVPLTSLLRLVNEPSSSADFSAVTVMARFGQSPAGQAINMAEAKQALPDYGYHLLVLAIATHKKFPTEARQLFSNIARINELRRDRGNPSGVFANTMTTTYEVDAKTGCLQRVRTSAIELLEGIDVSRIQRCPMCQTFFWAGRKDKPACSKNCGNRLRSLRWRERHRSEGKTPTER